MTTETARKKKQAIQEKLKDRRAYRQALIERRNVIDVKMHNVEGEISKLQAAQ